MVMSDTPFTAGPATATAGDINISVMKTNQAERFIFARRGIGKTYIIFLHSFKIAQSLSLNPYGRKYE